MCFELPEVFRVPIVHGAVIESARSPRLYPAAAMRKAQQVCSLRKKGWGCWGSPPPLVSLGCFQPPGPRWAPNPDDPRKSTKVCATVPLGFVEGFSDHWYLFLRGGGDAGLKFLGERRPLIKSWRRLIAFFTHLFYSESHDHKGSVDFKVYLEVCNYHEVLMCCLGLLGLT